MNQNGLKIPLLDGHIPAPVTVTRFAHPKLELN
jgi:hypothetical protein